MENDKTNNIYPVVTNWMSTSNYFEWPSQVAELSDVHFIKVL